jgi:acetaldehyde dehydrogenase
MPDTSQERVRVAILGSGNIGTDLMYKLLEDPGAMELALLCGIDPNSEGLARARGEGVDVSHEGLDAILADDSIRIVFDATSAYAHRDAAPRLEEAGKIAVDMTPAACGPYVVPPVNLGEHLEATNVNLITCGGQATIPLVNALHTAAPLAYAEMVSTVASASAGPGTRQNIDEFTFTTARALEKVGGPPEAKAIIILNPADPPILMRNTVYGVIEADDADERAITDSVEQMVAGVQRYVPGYRLKGKPVFDTAETPWGTRKTVALLLEVKGAGHFLPEYSGNLDIMTASARRVGQLFAQDLLDRTEVTA